MSPRQRHPRVALLVPIIGATAVVAAMVWSNQPWNANASSLVDPFALLLFGFAVVPHLLVAVGLMLSNRRSIGWVWWLALAYGVLASAGGILTDISIIASDSSTAALGFLVLPVYQLAGMVPAAAIAGLIRWGTNRHRRYNYGLS